MIGGIGLRILFGMVMRVSRELIEVCPPRETLRGILVMPGCLWIRGGTGCFFQLCIAGDDDGHNDGKENEQENEGNADGVAGHRAIIKATMFCFGRSGIFDRHTIEAPGTGRWCLAS